MSITNGFTITDFKTIDFQTVQTSKLRLVATTANFIPSIMEMEAYFISGNTGIRNLYINQLEKRTRNKYSSIKITIIAVQFLASLL